MPVIRAKRGILRFLSRSAPRNDNFPLTLTISLIAMKKGIILLIIAALLDLGCEQRREKSAVPSKIQGIPFKTQKPEGSVTTEQISPVTEPEQSAPELSPEERERLILGTEIEETKTK